MHVLIFSPSIFRLFPVFDFGLATMLLSPSIRQQKPTQATEQSMRECSLVPRPTRAKLANRIGWAWERGCCTHLRAGGVAGVLCGRLIERSFCRELASYRDGGARQNSCVSASCWSTVSSKHCRSSYGFGELPFFLCSQVYVGSWRAMELRRVVCGPRQELLER